MHQDAVTYIKCLQNLQAQIRLDWRNGRATSDYAADNVTDLLSSAPSAGMGRALARAICTDSPDRSPLADLTTRWWIDSLYGDPDLSDQGALAELMAGHRLAARQPITTQHVLDGLENLFLRDLNTLTDESAPGVTLSVLQDKDIRPDIQQRALNTLVLALPFMLLQAPVTSARAYVEHYAKMDPAELNSIEPEMFDPLPQPVLTGLHRLASRTDPSGHLCQRIADSYRSRIIAHGQTDPTAAWQDLCDLRDRPQSGEPAILTPVQLPVREVFLHLAGAHPADASASVAAELAGIDHTPDRLTRLQQYQAIAHDLTPPAAVDFLAHLHGHLAHQRDLLRPSRTGLQAQFQRLSAPEQADRLEAVCALGQADDVLRVALCKPDGDNNLSKNDNPLMRLARRLGTWFAPR